jgi:AcrR family transcriptional regulator
MQSKRRDRATGRNPVTKKRFDERPAVPTGRPPRERAGEVDERILDAARQVFLERGLAGASIDEIASLARAGKPTIYARFPSKEALFIAVGMRNVAANIARFDSYATTGTSIEERLTSAGVNFLQWALVNETIDLIQLSIAEGRRFPDLANSVHHMARERVTDAVARLLREAAQSDELGKLPAFAPHRLARTARFFLNLVVLPLLLRAILGEQLKRLRAEIEPHVRRSVAFFLAACRHGGVD